MKLYLTFLFIGISLVSYTQNSINGTVTNAQNEPLLGVEVYAPKLHKGTTTNLDGTYLIKNLPSGTVELVFSYVGFTSQIEKVTLNQNEITLNIVLKESVYEMDEVIVSTPFNKLQSENVMKVEHKSIAQLQKQGAPTLIQGLSNIAGVSQISTGTNIGKPVIRGLSGNRVLVYAQGVRLENQQFGGEHGLGINEAGVESVEVIKGPASLLYGSDALGGVLYLNPEKFAKENTIESTIGSKYFSNTLGSNSSFGFKASTEKLKFLSRLTYNLHSDYKIPNGDRVTNSRFEEYDVKTGLGFDTSNFSSEIRYNYTLSNIGIPEEIGVQSTAVSLNAPFQKIGNHILSAHNHFYFNNSKLDVNLGYLANDRKEFEEHHHDEEDHDEEDHEEEHEEEHEEDEAALHMKLRTFNYDVKYHLPKINKLESILGVQGLAQTNSNYGEEILIPDATTNDIGAFATGIINFDKHTFQGGIRFDTRSIKTSEHSIEHEDELHILEAIDKSFHSFTASLGYKTDLFDSVITRINLATGYRAPNLAELTSNGIHHGTNRYEIGNANLNNEQNYQLDIALEYKNEHIEFYANGFYNTITDFIFIAPTNEVIDDTNVFKYIQGDANLYGGEFGFHWHPHPLDWLHYESSFETVIGSQKNGNNLPLIPANQWKNTLRTEFNGSNWLTKGYASLKLESTFKQTNISAFETATDSYNLVHFSLGGDVQLKNTKFAVSFNVNNIFDTEYISHLSRLKTAGIQDMGRNLVLGINFNI